MLLLYIYKFLLTTNICNNHINIDFTIGINTFYLSNFSLNLLIQNLVLY
jgi:hypothetical protein